MTQHLQDLGLDDLKQRARDAGVPDIDQKNKSELIQAISATDGGPSEPGRGGGHGDRPKPPGTSPEEWKNIPGNQT